MENIIFLFLDYYKNELFNVVKESHFCKSTLCQNKFICQLHKQNFHCNNNIIPYYSPMLTFNPHEESSTNTIATTIVQEIIENSLITLSSHDLSPNSTMSSSNSITSKKNGSSGIFSSWKSKSKRIQPNEEDISKIPSDLNYVDENTTKVKESKSKLSIAKSRTETNKNNCEFKENSDKHQTTSLLRKLVRKSSNKFRTEITDTSSPKPSVAKIENELPLTQSANEKFSEINDGEESCYSSYSSYFSAQITSLHLTSPKDQHSDLNSTDILRELLDFTDRIRESETHLIHIISKYIQDRSLEKDLVGILTNHAKLQIDAERRTQTLTTEMWQQQIEIIKIQETTLKDNLNDLIKQNRNLQMENEELSRRNEKLIIKIKQTSDYPGTYLGASSPVIENLSKNNDRLRQKVNVMLAKIQEYEVDIERLQRNNKSVEQQLRNSHSQMQNYKARVQRIQSDGELEQAHLVYQLQVNQALIKECAEAGDVLLEDLDGLKRQTKSMPCTLNWTKFKSRGSSLPDLIHMCRSCINELAKELQATQTEIVLKDKDNNNLKEEVLRMEEHLRNSKSDQERLNSQLRAWSCSEQELKQYITKCSNYEREIADYKQQIEMIKNEFGKEKVTLITSLDDIDKLNKKLIEKEEELLFNKEKLSEYKSENDGLRMQIHGLKQVLSASGTGSVAKELVDAQEKMSFFQSQYYQLLSEKNYLIEQLQTVNVERSTINQYQNIYYQFIQTQQQDLESLSKDNVTLKQQLEGERTRILHIESDRDKMKEEKNVMRQIFRQLKNEINRVQKLEGEVADMNLEANRLAMIAEFNKQLGKKLQCEVTERDVKISELQSNVEELNNAQIESTKDKVALCVELTEVCTLNDQLSNSLNVEHQKNSNLDESKKQLENVTFSQLQAMEEMQRVERAALRELLKNYKAIVVQRDNLMTSQAEYLQQITDLRANAVVQTRNIECVKIKCKESVENASKLESKLRKSDERIENLQSELIELKNTKSELACETEHLKSDLHNLNLTTEYLKNNIRKLHSELNNSRETEVELKRCLLDETRKLEELQEAFECNNVKLTQKSEETQSLTQENSNLKDAYSKLLTDYNSSEADISEVKEELRRNTEEYQKLTEKHVGEIEFLKEIIVEKDLEYIRQQDYCNMLQERITQLENSLEDIDEQSKLLSESNSAQIQLQRIVNALQEEHAQCSGKISTLNTEKQNLEKELKTIVEKLNTDRLNFKIHLEEITKEYTDERNRMQTNLCTLSKKLKEITKECEEEIQARAHLLNSHKDLVFKLLKCVKMLIDERTNRKNAENSLMKLTQQSFQLSSEKESAEQTIKELSEKLEEMKLRIEQLDEDKKNMQKTVDGLQQLCTQTEFKYQNSEEQLRKIKMNKGDNSPGRARSSKILMLKETKSKLQATEERTLVLKEDLEKSHLIIMELKQEIARFKQNLTNMEFQKSEMALRLHEIQAQFNAEHNLNEKLSAINQKILSEVLRMKQNGIITREISEKLVELIQAQKEENLNTTSQ